MKRTPIIQAKAITTILIKHLFSDKTIKRKPITDICQMNIQVSTDMFENAFTGKRK